MQLKVIKTKASNIVLSIKGAIPSLKKSKWNVVRDRYLQNRKNKTKTKSSRKCKTQNKTNKQTSKKKNILPSLTQILTQRFQSVLSPPQGSSHSEVFPKTRITQQVEKIPEKYQQKRHFSAILPKKKRKKPSRRAFPNGLAEVEVISFYIKN